MFLISGAGMFTASASREKNTHLRRGLLKLLSTFYNIRAAPQSTSRNAVCAFESAFTFSLALLHFAECSAARKSSITKSN